MKFEKFLIFICLIMVMFTVAGVNASDVNDTVVASDETPDEDLSVSDNANVMTDTPAKPMKELNSKIIYAQSGDTINLTDDYYCEDNELENGIEISKSLTIDGHNHKLDGTGKMRIFQVTNNANVTFKNIIFTNGWTADGGYGGAIWNNRAKNIIAINCTFENNYATNGGAVSIVNAVNSTFKKNTGGSIPYEYGGAMYMGSAVNCTFVENHGSWGGAIAYCPATDCTFINNTGANGGAAYSSYSTGCTFINNTATDAGGAMWIGSATGCTFINNTAHRYGGAAAYVDTVANCSFINNTATESPASGAIHSCDVAAVNCTFINNNVCYTTVQFYINYDKLYLGDSVLFYGLPECNLIVNVTKNGKSKTFNCTDKGWKVEDLEPGIYTVTFTIKTYENNQGTFTTAISVLPVGGKYIQELNTLINSTQNDTIILNDDYYGVDNELENGIIINKPLTIDGQGHKIDANGIMRIFQVTNNANVTFKNIIFLNGWTGEYGYGGAIWNNRAESVTAINCTFEKNTASYGGAVSNVNAVNSTFKNNYASDNGGAMNGGYAVNSYFVNNTGRFGGAIHNGTAVNSSFVNNTASIAGAMNGGYAVNCSFVNNTASTYGSAIDEGTSVNCSFVNNNVYNTKIQFYTINNVVVPGDTVLFYGLPECNLTVTVTDKNNETTFNCTDKGWKIENLELGNYTVKFAIKYYDGNTGELKTAIQLGYELELNVIADSIFEGQNATVTISANNNTLNDNVTLSVNGTNYTVKLINGTGKQIISGLPVGNYTATVRFKGNDKIWPTEKSVKFEVKPKSNLNLTVNVEDIYVGQNATVKITTNKEVTGNVTVSINGNNHTVEVINGTGNYNISGLPIGNHTANVTFNGNYKFNPAKNSTKFEVKPKQDINLAVDVADIFVGQNANVKITTDKEFTGNVTVSINGNNHTVEVINGAGNYNISGLPIGNHTANVTFNGNYKFNPAKNSTKFEVKPKYDLDLTVNVEDINEGNIATVTVTTNATFNGTVKISINGTSIQNATLEISEGKGSYVAMNLSAGKYNVTVSFDGDYKINATSKSTTFEVKPAKEAADLNLTVSVEDIYVDQNATVKVTTNNTFNGKIILIINDIVKDNITVVNGVGSYSVKNLSAGNYTAYVGYNGDDTFKPDAKAVNFEVKKYNPDLTVNVADIFAGQNATVKITVNKEVTGNVTVSINGNNHTVEVINGAGNYNISGLPVGNHTANVTFNGNYKFNPAKNSTKFEVKPKYDLDLTVNVEDINEGNIATVTVTTNATFNGTVKISINGTSIQNATLEISEGKGSYVAMNLVAGKYNVTVSFDGDYKINATSKSTTFEVKQVKEAADLNLTVSVEDIFAGQNATVKVTTNNTFNGKIILIINGIVNDNITVVNGVGSYSVKNLSTGNYTAYVGYNGDDTFKPNATAFNFEVKPASELIDIIVPQGADTPEFTIKLPSDATGKLNVTINGKTYTAELVNGSATIKVPGLADGTYNITVSYSGDAKYPAVVKNTTVTIKNPVYKITNNKNIKMLYTAKTPYKVLVTKDGKAVGAGEIVKITFNGKTYNVKTDKNGYATLKIPNVKPKKATYAITAIYKGVTVKNKVKVNSIIKAKNKKVKKSKKVTKVKVSLKKVNGKYLKAKKLKIKFRGKTYKVKTNKKGVATWKVKKSMLKKLKVGKKYKYKVTYGKDKVTKKIKIKR